jgi:predicted ATPase
VLDSAEHVRAAGPALAGLLAQAPRLRLLVTSRVVLHLTGEHVYPVEPLRQEDAVLLFLERAREADPHLRLGPADEQAVREICRRLDGLPLAIELAAGRLRAISPPELLGRLDPRLRC